MNHRQNLDYITTLGWARLVNKEFNEDIEFGTTDKTAFNRQRIKQTEIELRQAGYFMTAVADPQHHVFKDENEYTFTPRKLFDSGLYDDTISVCIWTRVKAAQP